MYDLAELSHEDGLQLIDEMYGAEHPDCDAEDMDTSHDEMYYVPAETHQDLKEAHIREILLSNQEGAMTDNYLYLLKPNGHTSTDFNETKEVDIEANMSEARKLLQRARQELDKLKHTRQEMEPQYLWCLEKYTIMAQISVESRL
jgi:hypothetical protein